MSHGFHASGADAPGGGRMNSHNEFSASGSACSADVERSASLGAVFFFNTH